MATTQRATREPSPVAGVTRTRRIDLGALGALAIACACSVWPILHAQSVPAFQQDWTWPLSSPLALGWLHTFAGLWDDRGLGQGNALAWQTYAVVVQVALIRFLGPATGLAVWLASLEFAAACGCVALLDAFGVRSRPARFVAAFFYAFGPVAFTRIAAGHLAYLVGYALLPLAVSLAVRTIERRRLLAAVALGVTIGFAASQIQFLAIAWLAIAALVPFVPRAAGWPWRLLVAAGIAAGVQLQSLLPLLFNSAPAVYLGQRALISWEYNNSSPFSAALVMLGYFTHYYEAHALPNAYAVLCVLLAAAIALAIFASARRGAYALLLAALGAILTAGLYGPLSPMLAWAFEHQAYFTIFRDLHYFAALTALGAALALGLAIARAPAALALPAALMVAWIAAPQLVGGELREILVAPALANDALADMRTVEQNGPGRVVWLPAEEPLGPIGEPNQGRDFVAYGPSGNPSVSDDYQNPQLAYALATLRAGRPDWNAFAAMNVRYVVFRNYVRSGRIENFGTGFPMAFEGLGDAALGRSLSSAPRLVTLRRTALSHVYELAGNLGATYRARADERAALYSELAAHDVAVESAAAPALHLGASALTADPRADWVSGTLGWRYRDWMPDSIYPFVWTLSARPLTFGLPPKPACLLAGSLPRGALLRARNVSIGVRGAWNRYATESSSNAASATVLPQAGDVTAIAARACVSKDASAPANRSLFVFASGYDAGWRAIDRGAMLAPAVANGWMMAWDARVASDRLIYLPAIAQLVGLLLALGLVAVAIPLAARADVMDPDRPTRR